MADTGAVPVDEGGQSVGFPEGVAVPQVAVQQHAAPGRPWDLGDQPLGLGEQRRGTGLRAPDGEVLDLDRPHPTRQLRARFELDLVQLGGGRAESIHPSGRAGAGITLLPGQAEIRTAGWPASSPDGSDANSCGAATS